MQLRITVVQQCWLPFEIVLGSFGDETSIDVLVPGLLIIIIMCGINVDVLVVTGCARSVTLSLNTCSIFANVWDVNFKQTLTHILRVCKA